MPRAAPARPHNETVEQICAYLAANYRQKFSSPRWRRSFIFRPTTWSRLFRRVTGQSIVDYINNRRIEGLVKLLENDRVSISAVADRPGFLLGRHRRVFHEVMGTGPLQVPQRRQSRNTPAPSTERAQGVFVCIR